MLSRLRDIPFKVDVVDCFRRNEEIPRLADDAIAIGAKKALWLQLGVIHHEAARKASGRPRSGEMIVALKIEHGRLFGMPQLVRRQHLG
jgi:predicted CoA-binding protein